MKKALFIIDVQNDFIDGVLSNPDAQRVYPKILEFVKDWDTNSDIFRTYDTHINDEYGQYKESILPIHCVPGTNGWSSPQELNDIIYGKFNHYTLIKDTFAYIGELYNDLENYDEIHIFGFVTDICVISNALKLRSELPKSKIIVHSDLCAGTTPENHEAALKVMKSCLIDII